MQLSAGTLEPTPRGSNPIQSYAAPAPPGMNAPKIEKISPEPPGPPGLVSMIPWYSSSGTVWRSLDTANWTFSPCGLE
jgi:hypothetical protein